MAETEVTQGLFEAVMGSGIKPSYFTTNPEDGSADGWKALPVEWVSWYDAIAFCNKLSLLDGRTPVYSVGGISDWGAFAYGSIPTATDTAWDAVTITPGANGYRLPTEMQWMWAAMGATSGGATVTTDGYNKAFAGSTGSNAIGNYAWYDNVLDPDGGYADNKTHEVGKKTANELGLYDMSGNVYESIWDWFVAYDSGILTDPPGPASGVGHPCLGGNWKDNATNCTVAYRNGHYPNDRDYRLGFRFLHP
jgi:formylglycine-generating enzyme required for sulfatase activity